MVRPRPSPPLLPAPLSRGNQNSVVTRRGNASLPRALTIALLFPSSIRRRRKVLTETGAVEIIEADRADDPAAHPTILERVEGKVLAVDLSLWIFHAVSQPELADLFPPEGQVAKVVFERALNWLRHGCVPIGVLDGVPPPEKLATMRLRHPSDRGAGGEFRRLGDAAVSVLAPWASQPSKPPARRRRRAPP